MSIDPKEIETVLLLTAEDRYEFFLDQVSENGILWALCHETQGWPTFQDDEQGYTLFPLWSDEVFAQQCAVGEWEGFAPKSFTIQKFIDELAAQLESGNLMVSIFKKPDDSGFIIPPQPLLTIFQSFVVPNKS